MPSVSVTDACLWLKHIEDPNFKAALSSLYPGSKIALEVDGVSVDFERMATGVNGQPTMGLKPVGSSKTHWQSLYENRRGETVQIAFLGRLAG